MAEATTVERFQPNSTETLAQAELRHEIRISTQDIERATGRAVDRARILIEGVYDPSQQRYIRNGQAVATSEVRAVLLAIRTQLGNRIARHTEQLLNNEITLAEWEQLISAEAKDKSIAAALLGIGGVAIASNLNRQQYSALWEAVALGLGSWVIGLSRVGQRVSNGEYSPSMLRHYGRYKSSGVVGAYSQARKMGLLFSGFNEARRSLDPTANHCPDCPAYETDWTDVSNVVPVGVACRCNGNCRCRVEYRFNPEKAFQSTLIEQINLSKAVEEAALRRLR